MSLAQHLLQTMSQAVCCCDEHGVVQASSPAARTLLQHTPETLHDKTLLELIHPADIEQLEDALVSLTRQRPVAPCTLRLLNGDAFAHTYQTVRVRFTGHEEGSGLLENILLWLEPAKTPAPTHLQTASVTPSNSLESRATNQAATHSTAVNNTDSHNADDHTANDDFHLVDTPTALCVFDAQWRLMYLNETAAQLIDMTVSELMGQSLWQVFPDMQHNRSGIVLKRAMETQEPIYFEALSSDPRLDFAWFGVHALPVDDRLVVKVEDITERKYQKQQLEATQERNEQLFEQRKAILEIINDTVFVLDANFRFIYANQATLEAAEETLASIRKKTLWDIVNLPEGHPFYEAYLKTIQEQVPQRVRGISSLSKLAGHTLDIAMYPFQGGLIAYSRDVSKFESLRTDLAQALAEKEAILNSISDAFTVLDSNWTYVYANSRVLNRIPNIVGRNYFEVFPEHRNSVFAHNYQHAFDSQQPVFFEAKTLTLKPGEWASVRVYPIGDRVTIYANEITERKKLEHALIKSETKFRAFFEESDVAHFILNLQHPEVPSERFMTNRAFDRLFVGTRLAEVNRQLTLADYQTISKQLSDDYYPLLEQGLRGEDHPTRVSKRYLNLDGSSFWVDVSSVFVRDEQGEPLLIISSLIDITDRKRTEQALRDSEAKFRAFFERAAYPCTLFVFDADKQGKQGFFYNDAFADFMKHTAFADYQTELDSPEGLRHMLGAVSWPEDEERDRRYFAEVAAGTRDSYRMEKRYLNRNGSVIWGDLMSVAVRDGQGNLSLVLAVLQDITERKRVEQALHESETKFRRFFMDSTVPHFMIGYTDRTRQYVSIETNGAFEQLFANTVFADIPTRLPVNEYRALAVQLNHDSSEQNPFWSSPREKRYYNKDGSHFWCEVSSVIIEDTRSDATMCLSTLQNITARKQAQDALEKALADKEMLLKEVHHRTKNNMQLVSSMLAIQSRRIGDNLAQQALFESSKRISLLARVHQALYQTPENDEINVGEQLRHVLEGLTLGLRDAVITTHRDIADVHLDVHQAIPLMLVANELLTNVFKHAFPTSHIEDALTVRLILENDQVTLEIIDNGVGVPEDAADKDSLGMVIIATLTDQLNAELTLENQPGGGTVARVTFTKRIPIT